MRLRVVRTHLRGWLLPTKDLQAMPPVLGELLTITTQDECYRGEIMVAKLHDPIGGKQMDEVMPPLWAPMLEVLSPQGMLLTGHERIDERGEVCEYRQGWWAKLPLNLRVRAPSVVARLEAARPESHPSCARPSEIDPLPTYAWDGKRPLKPAEADVVAAEASKAAQGQPIAKGTRACRKTIERYSRVRRKTEVVWLSAWLDGS